MSQKKQSKNAQTTKTTTQVTANASNEIAVQVINNPDFLEKIDRELPEVVMQLVTKMHSGPIPDPETLEKYEQIHSGAANRIIAMAELEQAHRHNRENQELTINKILISENLFIKKQGQRFGIASVCIVTLFAAYLSFQGYPAVAASVATGIIVALVSVFVADRKYRNDRETSGEETEEI